MFAYVDNFNSGVFLKNFKNKKNQILNFNTKKMI